MKTEDQYPEIGVVIINWNNSQDTINCLKNLGRVSSLRYHSSIIVVDNGSTDSSVVELQNLEEIILLESRENIGFAAASNLGINQARELGCEYILLLNNDTSFETDFISPLINTIFDNPLVGIICPKILFANPRNMIWFAGGKFKKPRIIGQMIGYGETDDGQYDQEGPIDYGVGCCMLIKNDVFNSIGTLDEDFFFYNEDIDFSLRASKSGYWIWYQPSSVIVHDVSKSTRHDIPYQVYLYSRARTVFFIKHIRGIDIILVLVYEFARLIRLIAVNLIKWRLRDIKYYIWGLLAGLKDGYKILTN